MEFQLSEEVTNFLRRIEIRTRARVYVEHMVYWKTIQGGDNIATQTVEGWKNEVDRVESHILENEAPELSYIFLSAWKPLGVVFPNIMTGMELADILQ